MRDIGLFAGDLVHCADPALDDHQVFVVRNPFVPTPLGMFVEILPYDSRYIDKPRYTVAEKTLRRAA